MTQWQTPVLMTEAVRLALVQQFMQISGRTPNGEELDNIEYLVKYIYQSK